MLSSHSASEGPHKKEVKRCGPYYYYIQYLLQPNAKNSTKDLKELTRMKLCDFAYFAQGLADDLLTMLIEHVCPVYLETCYILHHSEEMLI